MEWSVRLVVEMVGRETCFFTFHNGAVRRDCRV